MIAALAALAVVELVTGVVMYRRRARQRAAGVSTRAASLALAFLLVAFLVTGPASAYLILIATTFPRGGF